MAETTKIFQKRNMAYNHGREDRAEFNSNRRFYRWTSDFGEYFEGLADTEPQAEPNTIADLLDENFCWQQGSDYGSFGQHDLLYDKRRRTFRCIYKSQPVYGTDSAVWHDDRKSHCGIERLF